MENVLLISGTVKGQGIFTELFRDIKCDHLVTVSSGGEARRLLIDGEFELVIINAPLIDEFGNELAVTVANTTSAGVILIVKSELEDEISLKVEDYGVLVVAKPFGKQVFYQTIKLAAASHRRMLSLKKENVKLLKKIDEIRLVDRAKCVLIQYLNLTEQQAHRYIEKQAMDMRLTRREIAEKVLTTYEY